MSREFVVLTAAALAMAIAAPLGAAPVASRATAQSAHANGIVVALNAGGGSSADTAGKPDYRYHHHSHRRYRHHYSSRHRHSRPRRETAAEDPKASAPEATPTAGVIPRISP